MVVRARAGVAVQAAVLPSPLPRSLTAKTLPVTKARVMLMRFSRRLHLTPRVAA
jgi:hypothetical protein